MPEKSLKSEFGAFCGIVACGSLVGLAMIGVFSLIEYFSATYVEEKPTIPEGYVFVTLIECDKNFKGSKNYNSVVDYENDYDYYYQHTVQDKHLIRYCVTKHYRLGKGGDRFLIKSSELLGWGKHVREYSVTPEGEKIERGRKKHTKSESTY